jgi:tetratricopeptide (TPR) repeat protein
MRLAILLALLVSAIARAQTPQLDAAEKAWKAAEQGNTVELWSAAATLFDSAVASATGPWKETTAATAVLAWKNARALESDAARPNGLTPRDRSFVKSLEVYLPLAKTDADAASTEFTRAQVFFRANVLADAVSGFEHIVVRFPDSDVAELSATLLLDALNRLGKHDRMSDWVAKMRATPVLLKGRPDLVATLDRLHVQIRRRKAEALEARHEFAECAQVYCETARLPKVERKDELLFNAGICFEQAGQTADAIRAFEDAARLKTSLAPAAKARAKRLR